MYVVDSNKSWDKICPLFVKRNFEVKSKNCLEIPRWLIGDPVKARHVTRQTCCDGECNKHDAKHTTKMSIKNGVWGQAINQVTRWEDLQS